MAAAVQKPTPPTMMTPPTTGGSLLQHMRRLLGTIAGALKKKIAPPMDKWWVDIPKAVRQLCKTTKFTRKECNALIRLQVPLVRHLKVLHDRFVSDKDAFALWEANFLVDYYCSSVILLCADDVPLEIKSMEWWSGSTTYDDMKYDPHPGETYQRANHWLLRTTQTAVRTIQTILRTAFGNDSLNWHDVMRHRSVINDVLRALRITVEQNVKYYASGWGAFRLMHMKMPSDKHALPCSCICYALVYTTILRMLEFPSEYLFVTGQAEQTAYKDRKKLTHWVTTCYNPLAEIKGNIGHVDRMLTIYDRQYASSHSFALFTRDIIWYYTHAYPKMQGLWLRDSVLNSLRLRFDAEFDSKRLDLQTPPASRALRRAVETVKEQVTLAVKKIQGTPAAAASDDAAATSAAAKPAVKKPRRRGTPKSHDDCPEDKIINPDTRRCVLVTGKIGRRLLRERQR